MVYIDGDAMGKQLFESGGSSKNEYRRRSREIRTTVEGGLADACAQISRGLEKDATAPFEALLTGGDDAIVLVRAKHAMEFLFEFDRAWNKGLAGVHYSAGIVWAHHHYPVSQFLAQAEALLRSAKRRQGENSVDFRIVTEARADAEIARESDLTTEKPYSVSGLRDLRDKIRKWKTKGVSANKGVPANKVNELYRIAFEPLQQARMDYEFLLSRLGKEERKLMADAIGTALFDVGTLKTRAVDAVEIWSMIDAVDEEQEKAVAAQGQV